MSKEKEIGEAMMAYGLDRLEAQRIAKATRMCCNKCGVLLSRDCGNLEVTQTEYGPEYDCAIESENPEDGFCDTCPAAYCQLCADDPRIMEMLEEFSTAMAQRLLKKQLLGFRGWDTLQGVVDMPSRIEELLEKSSTVYPNRWIDIANLAMFMWAWERKEGE